MGYKKIINIDICEKNLLKNIKKRKDKKLKTNNLNLLAIILLIIGLSFFVNRNANSQDIMTELKILVPSPDSNQSSYQRYGYFSQQIDGPDGKYIKYIYSEDINFLNNDTLETYLAQINYLVKIIDNEGLVLTITIAKYLSSDGLFNGYVDWFEPIWNEKNPNIIKAEAEIKNQSFNINLYKDQTFDYFASECRVLYGWHPVIPADFISKRDTTRRNMEVRNVVNLKTVEPMSSFLGQEKSEPLIFWAQSGTLQYLKDLKDKRYSKRDK